MFLIYDMRLVIITKTKLVIDRGKSAQGSNTLI